MRAITFPLFDDALDAFARAAPIGTKGLTIRAGRRECEAFRQWCAAQPGGRGAVKPGAPIMEYAGMPIEPVSKDAYLSVSGKTADDRPFEWPEAE